MNTSSYGRAVSSALLTRALKQLRQGSGQQHHQVADALQWRVSKLIEIESSALVSEPDLAALLAHYGIAGQAQAEELAAWARESSIPGWWESFPIRNEAFERYVGYEVGAGSIRMAQELLVPGILQTEEYARLISSSYRAPDDVGPAVQLRLARQEAVFARAPEQHHILDEAALRRRVGDSMSRQLRHLAELSEQPEITIRVIPFGAGPHFGMKGPFVLLDFDVPLGTVLFLESGRRSDLIICEEETYPGQVLPDASGAAQAIAAFEDGFSDLDRLALDETDSAVLIEQIARESPLLPRENHWLTPSASRRDRVADAKASQHHPGPTQANSRAASSLAFSRPGSPAARTRTEIRGMPCYGRMRRLDRTAHT